MSDGEFFQRRIKYQGKLDYLLLKVAKDFELGRYIYHEIVMIGYEDFNVVMKPEKGKYLVKMMANYRTSQDIERYVSILEAVTKNNIALPNLYKTDQGLLHSIRLDGSRVDMFVMEYIEGSNLYELQYKPTKTELAYLARQLTKINSIDFHPSEYYDNWSVVYLAKEYDKLKNYVSTADLALITPVKYRFDNLDLDALPHSFVHGDVLDSNILKDKNGTLWIIDFSVANWLPRIHELAVFLSGTPYDPKHEEYYMDNYYLVLNEYQKHLPLTKAELDLLPLYLKAAQAICILGVINEINNNGESAESEFWLSTARKGLQLTSKLFD